MLLTPLTKFLPVLASNTGAAPPSVNAVAPAKASSSARISLIVPKVCAAFRLRLIKKPVVPPLVLAPNLFASDIAVAPSKSAAVQ